MNRSQSAMRRRILGALGLAAAVPARLAQAQAAYPSKSIRLVIPFAVGGSTDIVGRLLAQKLGDGLGVAVVPDNRPGANGTIGADAVAKSAPDGYTLVIADIGGFSMAPGLYPNLPYDPIRDFEPITLVARSPLVLTVGADSPIRSLSDLIETARSKPDSLNYPSSGNGGPNHLAAALFDIQAKVRTTHVPYKGSGPSVLSLVSGETDFGFLTTAAVNAQLQAGKLRAIALASPTRLASMPSVPTMSEAGLPGFEAEAWFMLAAPAGTPAPILDRLQKAAADALALPDVKEKFDAIGVERVGNSRAEATAFLKAEIAKWTHVIRTANIKLS